MIACEELKFTLRYTMINALYITCSLAGHKKQKRIKVRGTQPFFTALHIRGKKCECATVKESERKGPGTIKIRALLQNFKFCYLRNVSSSPLE